MESRGSSHHDINPSVQNGGTTDAGQLEELELSLWDILFVPLRYWFRTFCCFALIVAAVIAFTVMTPKKYQSESKLLVRLGRENMGLDPTATLGNSLNVNMTQTRQAEINSVATILRNRNLAAKVVDKITAERILDKKTSSEDESSSSLPPQLSEFIVELMPSTKLNTRDKAIRLLQKEVEVEALPESNLVAISYTSDDPELSRDVVSSLVDFYLEEHVALHRNEGAYKFLLSEKESVQSELRETEDALTRLKRTTGLVSPAEQRGTLVTQIGRLRDQQTDTRAQIAEVTAEVKMLREKFAGLPETIVLEETQGAANFASDGMREQLYGLQLAEKRLLASHTEEHPEVIRIRKQIAEAEKILSAEEGFRTEVSTGPNRVYQETQLQLITREPVLSALIVKDERQTELLAELVQDLQHLNDHELQVNRLTREVEIQDANYRKYSIDTEQARIDNDLLNSRLSNIEIAQPATLDPYPAYPKSKVNLMLGVVFAFCASCGLAFVSDSFDRYRKHRRQQRSSARHSSPSVPSVASDQDGVAGEESQQAAGQPLATAAAKPR